MTDIHTHVLPLVDDGSENFENSFFMIEEAIKQGVKNLICTPHYRRGIYACSADEVRSAFNDFKAQVKEKGYDINLYLGREITVHKGVGEKFESGQFLPLADGKFVLLEFPYDIETDIDEICYRVRMIGYYPVIAHIERYSYFRSVEMVEQLRKNGVVVTVNAASVVKKSYPEENKFTKQLLKKRLVDVVASDYHFNRVNYFKHAYDKVKSKYGKDYADLIFELNPNQIIGIK